MSALAEQDEALQRRVIYRARALADPLDGWSQVPMTPPISTQGTAEGAAMTIIVNPLIPVSTEHRAVPTGHDAQGSVRDKGLLWVFNQSMRVAGARADATPALLNDRPRSSINSTHSRDRLGSGFWLVFKAFPAGGRSLEMG